MVADLELAGEIAEAPARLQILNLSSGADSLSEVVEPPALAKSKQKAPFSNFSGKLSFSRLAIIGIVLSELLKERVSALLRS